MAPSGALEKNTSAYLPRTNPTEPQYVGIILVHSFQENPIWDSSVVGISFNRVALEICSCSSNQHLLSARNCHKHLASFIPGSCLGIRSQRSLDGDTPCVEMQLVRTHRDHARLYLIMRNSPSQTSWSRGARQKQDGFEKNTAVQTILRCLVASETSFTVCFRRAVATCFPSVPHWRERT